MASEDYIAGVDPAMNRHMNLRIFIHESARSDSTDKNDVKVLGHEI
jgi:hypothetical protein